MNKIRRHWRVATFRLKRKVRRTKQNAPVLIAKVRFEAQNWAWKNRGKIEISIWALIAAMIWLSLSSLQNRLSPFLNHKQFEAIQTLALTVGGAMIGATAIASSFVLFAMQVNVERLPYGLFKRFSSDPKLISIFGVSFILSITSAFLSLISEESFAAIIIFLTIVISFAVIRFLLLAYHRSFVLVNPLQQVQTIYKISDRNLKRLESHLSKIVPSPDHKDDQFDTQRRSFFDSNPNWDLQLKQAIEHTVSFARRGGEQGDLDISRASLSFLVALNARYVTVKGRTFFANNLMIDNPFVTDGVINTSLEALRRLREAALARRDEAQLEQIFGTLTALTQTYLQIDYGPGESRTHALLAGAYLKRSVEATLPHNLTDTSMHGVRSLGAVSRLFFLHGCPDEGTDSMNEIAVLGMLGAASERHRPLTLAAMEELRDLTLVLIRIETRQIDFAAGQLRDAVTQVAEKFLEIPDNPVFSFHSSYLGPYFSGTSYTSLPPQLVALANALQDPRDAAIAELCADHIAAWSDQIYLSQKRLLLLSIKKHSHFSFDIIHWITAVTEILIVVSHAPHTRNHTKGELEKNALWLISVLSWIPTDNASARFVENLSYRTQVFEMGLKARKWNWPDGFDKVWTISLRWALSAGKEHTGWGTLDRWLTSLCALALWEDVDQSKRLKRELIAMLQSPDAPDQEMRDHAAVALREIAQALDVREFEMDLVKRILAVNNRRKTRKLLRDVAYILSPATIHDPVQISWF